MSSNHATQAAVQNNYAPGHVFCWNWLATERQDGVKMSASRVIGGGNAINHVTARNFLVRCCHYPFDGFLMACYESSPTCTEYHLVCVSSYLWSLRAQVDYFNQSEAGVNLLLMSIFDQIGSILEICSAREISHRSFWNCIHIGFYDSVPV